MQLHRREYARKSEDEAIEEESRVVTDLKNWENHFPILIEKIESSRCEIRIGGLRSLCEILSNQYIGFQLLEMYLSRIMDGLRQPMYDYVNFHEHNEAFRVICSLSLQAFDDFQEYSSEILDEVMPLLKQCNRSESFRFFAIAFIVSFSVQSQELCIRVLTVFLDLLGNKKSRANKFEPETIVEIIRGIALMLAVFPEEVCTQGLTNPIINTLDYIFHTHDTDVLVESCHLLTVVFESIRDYTPEDDSLYIAPRSFASRFLNKLPDIELRAEKKSDQKRIKSAVSSVQDYFNGSNMNEEITLNHQVFIIEGPRKLTIMNAIRRITNHHFQHQMVSNPHIHEIFGIDLMSKLDALRLKKRFKSQIEKERIVSKKDREQSITKKRNIKEHRQEDPE